MSVILLIASSGKTGGLHVWLNVMPKGKEISFIRIIMKTTQDIYGPLTNFYHFFLAIKLFNILKQLKFCF